MAHWTSYWPELGCNNGEALNHIETRRSSNSNSLLQFYSLSMRFMHLERETPGKFIVPFRHFKSLVKLV